MIISRTPFRISLVGGGSDLPSFYRHHPGAVVTTSIDKYVYITLNKNFDSGVRLKYSETEEVDSFSEIKHDLIRESLRLVGIHNKIEITSLADIPVKGTGLGSSSSYLVGLLNAMKAYKDEPVTLEQLAKDSYFIERDKLNRPVGKQDHYIASYGGLNLISFLSDGSVKVEPIVMPNDTHKKLQENLHLFYTGITRNTAKILEIQDRNFETNETIRSGMRRMVTLTNLMVEGLRKGYISNIGEMLHENWEIKKTMAHNISNPQIDSWYEVARKAGAEGGKILGAGGGGFLLLYIPEDSYESVVHALSPLEELKFNFEPRGSVVFNMKNLGN